MNIENLPLVLLASWGAFDLILRGVKAWAMWSVDRQNNMESDKGFPPIGVERLRPERPKKAN